MKVQELAPKSPVFQTGFFGRWHAILLELYIFNTALLIRYKKRKKATPKRLVAFL